MTTKIIDSADLTLNHDTTSIYKVAINANRDIVLYLSAIILGTIIGGVQSATTADITPLDATIIGTFFIVLATVAWSAHKRNGPIKADLNAVTKFIEENCDCDDSK